MVIDKTRPAGGITLHTRLMVDFHSDCLWLLLYHFCCRHILFCSVVVVAALVGNVYVFLYELSNVRRLECTRTASSYMMMDVGRTMQTLLCSVHTTHQYTHTRARAFEACAVHTNTHCIHMHICFVLHLHCCLYHMCTLCYSAFQSHQLTGTEPAIWSLDVSLSNKNMNVERSIA